MKYLLISLLLSACAHPDIDRREGSVVDPEVIPYLVQFELDYNTKVHDIPFTIRDIINTTVGFCREVDGRKEIVLDIYFWNDATKLQKLALVYHELGHCWFNLDHDNFYLPDGCPGSLMDSYQPHTGCLLKHWDYYVKQLYDLYKTPSAVLRLKQGNKEINHKGCKHD